MSTRLTFSAITGHARVIGYLRRAAREERLPHALLFAGADGIGKRAVASALAAWLQCTNGGEDACGDCAACMQVGAGSHPDVRAVGVAAGKKEIGVDRARDVKRFIQLRPVLGRTKIAIIDDAHMLTVAAQNALLKTLEEPSDRSVLILVASSPDALLPTVRSRCQRIQFGALADAAVVEVLTAAGIDAEVARQSAALAEGSPGRALRLAEALPGVEHARLATLLAGLGEAGYVRVMQLASELSRPETQLGLKLETVLAHYRAVAAAGIDGDADPAEIRGCVRAGDAVHEAWAALRRGNPNRQLLLESLLLRLARP